MTFDAGQYMKFNLFGDDIVELNYVESIRNKEEDLCQRLHNLNFRIHRLALINNNNKINFKISNPSIITFSYLKIDVIKKIK